jgi:hypothetical protein
MTGSFVENGGTMSIEARVLDVEQAKVVLAVRQQGPVKRFFELQRKLAQKLLAGIGAKVSLLGKKKIGARSTRNYKAFQHYSKSLAARDAKNPAAEKKALEAALALDPSFGAVKSRLAKLETRVKALETAGGLILSPTRADQHAHNAALHRKAGRASKAKNSALAGLALDPLLVDCWRELGRLSVKAGKLPAGLKLSVAQRRLAQAFVDKKTVPLWNVVRQQPKRRARTQQTLRFFAAALLFERLDGPAPYASAYTVAMLHDAGRLLQRAGQTTGGVRWVNRPAFERRLAARMKALFPSLGFRFARRHGMFARIKNPRQGRYRRDSAEWELRIGLQDVPTEISVRVQRSRLHPHWRERKQLPPGYMRFAGTGYWNMPKRLLRALGKTKQLIYRPRYPAPRRTLMGKTMALRLTKLGAAMKFDSTSIQRCNATSKLSTTGRCGYLSLFISKGTLLPGCYEVSVSYRDENGQQIELSAPLVWAHEFKKAKFWGSRRFLLTHLNERYRQSREKRYPELKKVRFAYRHLLNLLPVYAERWSLGSFTVARKRKYERYPLEAIAYDIDYSLNGKKTLALDDVAAWRRYRDRVAKRGTKIDVLPYRSIAVPIKALPAGKHSICIVGIRINGSLSPEPECMSLRIPFPPAPR